MRSRLRRAMSAVICSLSPRSDAAEPLPPPIETAEEEDDEEDGITVTVVMLLLILWPLAKLPRSGVKSTSIEASLGAVTTGDGAAAAAEEGVGGSFSVLAMVAAGARSDMALPRSAASFSAVYSPVRP